jgi:ketosteroid isomerase-like protein
MTQDARNTQVVQDAYAAFARADIPALLALIADDVVWKGVYGAGAHVPTAGERRGKAAVAEFFTQVAASISFSRFEPREFVATGDTVVALGHYTGTSSTGAAIDSDFAMVFRLRAGRIAGFQEFCNTAAIDAAFPKTVVAV